MKTKDAITYAFGTLVLASFLAIADIMTGIRDAEQQVANNILCVSEPSYGSCDRSAYIGTGDRGASALLTVE